MTHLAARVMEAVVPVYLHPALIEGMDELVRDGVVHHRLVHLLVLAQDDLLEHAVATSEGRRGVLTIDTARETAERSDRSMLAIRILHEFAH